ncbi:MAG: sigma-70 family RNA polymerase sigma factor [Atopobiaceae bacterium]|nr:sigma-70 family RNA polymerase sigma factor [Atopobiaceae bacterium]
MGADSQRTHVRVHEHTHNRSASQEFEKLYRESYSMVYGYIRSRVTSTADAEDIVADAYLKAAQAFSRFDSSRAKFSTWVITIAHNCMISYFRKQRPTTDLENLPESLTAEQAREDSVDARIIALQLLSVLNDDERALVLLKYQAGMRNVDIAHELNLNASTVSTVLARALAKMREAYERTL